MRVHLLNNMLNTLFDLFVSQKSAKEICVTLEKRYRGDAVGKEKYVVGKWLEFQMVDDKLVMKRIHEYVNLVVDVLRECSKICEIVQANLLLEKFPPAWSDYIN